jgi:hypothetical protein
MAFNSGEFREDKQEGKGARESNEILVKIVGSG